jgi:hypothetical protein
MSDSFYVLFYIKEATFLMENGETTKWIYEAERFETLKQAKEEKQKLDEPRKFYIFKVNAEYWLKRV